MPVLTGLRAAFYPNPTEARRIAFSVQKWQATLMAGTPSFLKAIFKAARPGQLASLRLMVTGAERAPEELFAMVEHIDPQARLLEGYGITECAPVVSVVRPDEQALGVGRPLPGVELLVVDLDTHTPVPHGSRGLILVHGPSVFPGYLGNVASPFIEIAGTQWYNTGDLGYLGPDGSLVIAGRLKRFIKIGGEMISLPAIEEALAQTWSAGEDAPSCAVAAVEPPGQRPHIALFTILNITVDMVNDALRTAGLGALVRIASVHRLDAIPLLGTGKTDYRALNDQLARILAPTQ